MFKSFSDSIRSLWSNSTNDINRVPVGSKRKRDRDEFDDDPDVQIVRIEKKRKTGHPGFLDNFRSSASRMAKSFAQTFYSKPKEHPANYSNSQENGNPTHIQPKMNGDDKQLANQRFALRHDISRLIDRARNGDSQEKRPRADQNMSNCSQGSSFFRKNKQSTASMCIRLKEKEQYQKLLQLQTSHKTPWDPSLRISEPNNEFNSNKNRRVSSDLSRSVGSSYRTPCEIPHKDRRTTHKPAERSIDILRSESLSSLLYKQRKRSGLGTVPYSDRDLRSDTNVGDSINSSVSARSQDLDRRSLLTNDTIVIDDDDDVSRGTPTQNENIGAIDSQSLRNSECSFRTSFLQSKYMNDDNVEDERRARTEEQQRRKLLIENEEAKAEAYEKKRRAQEISLEKKLKYQMRIFEEEPEVCEEIFLEEEEEEEEPPKLTDEMERMVNTAWCPGNPGEILAEGFRLQITRRDMYTLSGLNWLNDEVINFYMNLLMERGEKERKVYAFNTFFYPKIMSGGHDAVKRWTKKVDIFDMNYILIPVHLGMHWCLCVADMKKKKITYYDSMGAENTPCLRAVYKYINKESIVKKQTSLEESEWELENAKENPQQMNGGDCGMFMCKYADYITRGKQITFTQKDMPYFRRRMVVEIMKKQLLE